MRKLVVIETDSQCEVYDGELQYCHNCQSNAVGVLAAYFRSEEGTDAEQMHARPIVLAASKLHGMQQQRRSIGSNLVSYISSRPSSMLLM